MLLSIAFFLQNPAQPISFSDIYILYHSACTKYLFKTITYLCTSDYYSKLLKFSSLSVQTLPEVYCVLLKANVIFENINLKTVKIILIFTISFKILLYIYLWRQSRTNMNFSSRNILNDFFLRTCVKDKRIYFSLTVWNS